MRRPPELKIIETLAWHPGQGALRRDRHLDRMQASALHFGFGFDRAAASALLDLDSDAPLRCRLTLDGSGGLDLTTAILPPTAPAWRVAIHPTRLDPDDAWLGHKTTNRALYDAARAALPPGVDEYLFLNTRDELCEGSITNLFIETADGARLTPARACGLLPGVLREELLVQGVREAVLRRPDLSAARQFWVGNALRGLMAAQLVTP